MWRELNVMEYIWFSKTEIKETAIFAKKKRKRLINQFILEVSHKYEQLLLLLSRAGKNHDFLKKLKKSDFFI